MHTIFINASQSRITDHLDALWMEREYKQYIALDCPLANHASEEKGFAACALRIGEQIDISKEINNDFNMVVYVDYLEMEKHFRELFPDFDTNTWVENAVYDVAEHALMHLCATSLHLQMEMNNRLPKEKILLLIEQKPRADVNVDDYTENEEMLRSRKLSQRIDVLCALLGLPSEAEMIELAKKATDGAALVQSLRESAQKNHVVINGVDWQELYKDHLETFYQEVSENVNGLSIACEGLEDAVSRTAVSDRNNIVLPSSFISDRRGLSVNKALETKRNLLLQMFLWECIHTNTVYADGCMDASEARKMPRLTEEDWKQLAKIFCDKQKGLDEKLYATRTMKAHYRELGLAPPLYALPYEKFGLDKTGNLPNDKTVKVKSAAEVKKEKDDKKKKGKTEQENDKPERLIEPDRTAVEKADARKTNWLEGAYESMDVDGEELDATVTRSTTAEEFMSLAEDLLNLHGRFMSDLSQRVGRVMSHYAGRSMENEPALLRKRAVSANDALHNGGNNDYKYTDGEKKLETDVAENVVERAKQSYLSLLMGYLRFNASRRVAMTNLDEQVRHFTNRIVLISESLKVLHKMLFIVAAFLGLLYVPFPLIQWELITKNANTVMLSLLTFVPPVVLLGLGYVWAVERQKRKMKQAWDKLMEKSREIAAENKKAVRDYEELLTMHLPSLRWIYEYVLDVDFFRDCSRIAAAKLKHHEDKLCLAHEMLGNIVEDLECDSYRYDAEATELKIDYTQAFCEGCNRQVYAVIDNDVQELMRKGRSA